VRVVDPVNGFAWGASGTAPALVFAGVVVWVLVAAAGIVVRQVSQLARRQAKPSLSRYEMAVLVLAGAGVLCIAYGRWVEPYRLEVTHIPLASPKLSAASRPIRIVQLSDLHCDPQQRLEPRLPAVVAAERPDLIVFTGDAINSPGALPGFQSLLRQLAALAPTYVVRGNWDAWYWRHLDLFGGTGAVELQGSAVEVSVAGTRLWLAGAGVEEEDRIGAALSAVPPGAYTILLYHYPDEIEGLPRRKVDLYCAGHTHGGQVALPLYGALITLARHGKRYEAGLYRVGETWLYVNRGIGMEGGAVPRVRFWARPEVTVFELW
jgi:predicted MPP superfamily phosphohydrolase